MKALWQWWQERNAREQAFLAAAALVLVVTGGYLAVEPVFREVARMRAEIPELRQDLHWMQRHVAEVQELRQQGSAAPTNEDRPVLPTVERTARAQDVRESLNELEDQGSDAVRARLDGVAFPALLDWLTTLRERAGITVVKADIQRPKDGKAGRVDAELVLRRAGEEES